MRLRKRGGINTVVNKTLQGGRPGRAQSGLGVVQPARKQREAASSAWRPVQRSAASAAGLFYAPAGQGRRGFRLSNPMPLLVMAATVIVVAAMVLGAVSLLGKPAQAQGEMMALDGRPLCVVQERTAAEEILNKVQDSLRQSYGMDISHEGTLTFTPVTCDAQNIADVQAVEQALKANLEVKVVASVILVNGRPAVALKSAEEAQQALDTVLAPYLSASGNRQRTDVSFVENVRVEQQPVDFSLVMSCDEAVRALTLGSAVEDNFYTVEKGDSLARIAKEFELQVADIKKANPTLSSDQVLQPGDTLNAVKPSNWVNVRYTETVTRQEALPYETVEQTDATLYTTQKQTKQEGKNGLRQVVAKVTYINGMEASKVIESQTVIEEAQDKIVLRGTKKVPTSSGGGSSASGKYIKPLKSYRVTSRYGPRDMFGRSYHYGYDLAAPTGTPIYATAAGTVSFSGSASGYGLVIYLDHAGGVQSRYGHCSKLLVKKGQKVKQGQIIALVGSTGQSTGPHLHFEFRLNGGHVNPKKYVKLE